MKILLLIISFSCFSQPLTIEKKEIEDQIIYLKGFNQFNDKPSSFSSFNENIPMNANVINNYLNELNIRNIPIHNFSSDEVLRKEDLINNLETLLSEYRSYQDAKNPSSVSTSNTFLWDYHTLRGRYSYKLIDNYKKVELVSIYDSNLKCANGEYCSFNYNKTNVGSKNLGRFKGIKQDGSEEFFNLYVEAKSIGETVPHRTGDYGCANADTFSASNYNIWTCDGSKSSSCTRFCYNSACVSGTDPIALFNSNFNNGYMTVSSWTRTTGDLRSGCGGKFVYGIKVVYTYFKFYIRVNKG
jgi:hypothetical protein